LLLVVRF